MELKVDQLFSEANLAKALGVGKSTLYGLRRKGLPWVSLGGKPFYYEPDFMAWILNRLGRCADLQRFKAPEDASTPQKAPQEGID